ncbi:Acg family FMN-binding oxidoreductase [Krasilnikovia sp. MM14-A1259]|uniref:Acg family FMN-binding oxidoreductase n=1 Tax=Krasilnikovia sp. MM14-A1259 TaxID=3373539 RepID=UPI00380616CB
MMRSIVDFDLAEFLVGAAVRAPSVHNTQPWRFVHRPDGGVELWADPRRRLPIVDPAGRELIISCGAALATLMLGVRWLGHQPWVRRWPDPAHRTLVARVAVGPAYETSTLELDMFATVLERHTHRGPFDDVPVAPGLLVRLRRLASRAGCRAIVLDDDHTLRQVAHLTAKAQRAQDRQPAMRAELDRWLRPPGSSQRDGLTKVAGGVDAGPGRFTPRALGPGTPTSTTIPLRHRWPTTMLLTTGRDDPRAWLRAGQALQRMLLHAANHGVHAALYTQPLEIPVLRAELKHLAGAGHPQMLFQLGHTEGGSSAPRRPPAQVLTAG